MRDHSLFVDAVNVNFNEKSKKFSNETQIIIVSQDLEAEDISNLTS